MIHRALIPALIFLACATETATSSVCNLLEPSPDRAVALLPGSSACMVRVPHGSRMGIGLVGVEAQASLLARLTALPDGRQLRLVVENRSPNDLDFQVHGLPNAVGASERLDCSIRAGGSLDAMLSNNAEQVVVGDFEAVEGVAASACEEPAA